MLRRYLDRRSTASLGFAFARPWFTLLMIGAALGLVMQSAVFLVELALGYTRVISLSPLTIGIALVAPSIPFWLFAAAAEEVPLRGYFFQNLWEEFGLIPSAILTAIFFGALHLGNPNSHASAGVTALTVVGIAGYGLLACWSVVLTRSLWLAIGVHSAWNICEGPVYGFPVSGFKTPAIVHQSGSGPDWFTGGAFGPEAGAIIIVPLALAALLLFWLQRAGAFAKLPDAREAYAIPKNATPSVVPQHG